MADTAASANKTSLFKYIFHELHRILARSNYAIKINRYLKISSKYNSNKIYEYIKKKYPFESFKNQFLHNSILKKGLLV